jgi:hypothetical protein
MFALRAFISFASEDAWARDFLVRQSRFSKTPWTFEDGSLRVPFDDRMWKRRVHPLIEGSDLLVLLIGRETHLARGAIWEVECARELSMPIFGVQIKIDAPGCVPDCMRGIPVVSWRFEEIGEQLDRSYEWALWRRAQMR